MSSCGWSGNMTFLCCRMKGGRMRLFSPLGFRRAPCPDMFPGMWHNLGTIRASAEACGACQRTLWQLRAAVKTNKQVLLLRAGAEGGALVDFSHAALTLTSLLSALSCSAGQCQHRQSVARVFFFYYCLRPNWLLDPVDEWKSTVTLLEGFECVTYEGRIWRFSPVKI